jgi:O-antigen/teichoic acid export membrane protein
MEKDKPARRALIMRCWLLGAMTMASILLVFSLAWRPIVHLLLSDAYLPAVPVIRTYMVGDFLRVWVSFATYIAFARGRPDRYAAIEVTTWLLMALIVATLISVGNPNAPQIGYAGAYAVAAAITTAMFLWRPSEDLRFRVAPLR